MNRARHSTKDSEIWLERVKPRLRPEAPHSPKRLRRVSVARNERNDDTVLQGQIRHTPDIYVTLAQTSDESVHQTTRYPYCFSPGTGEPSEECEQLTLNPPNTPR